LLLASSLLEKEPIEVVMQRLNDQLASLKEGNAFDEMLTTKRPATGRDRKVDAARNIASARKMRAAGASFAAIAKELNLSTSTVHGYLKRSE
jgi:DNA-binding NarL/FixJ family response regulator